MSRVFIAEKPSLGRAIASGLGKPEKFDGYLKVGDDIVTWCFGHLLENAPPEHYDPKWSKWDIQALPIQVKEWQLQPRGKKVKGKQSEDPGVKKQLDLIAKLLKKADVVVNAGDPDREGQLLVDEVLIYLGWKGDTRRILLNATDPASVAKALKSIRPNTDFKNLYRSALCRSRADWLVGMNLTVAATKTFGDNKVTSIGRVQTPTLAMVVRRDREIENFKSAVYYYLIATVDTGASVLEMSFNPKDEAARIKDKGVASKLAGELMGKTVPLDISRQTKTERPPLPYMLATFQKDSEEKLKFGAKKSLEALQELYEAKLTSYPRTERELLPPEQAPSAVKIASAVMGCSILAEATPLKSLMTPSDRIYSLPKDAEHHGVVPTGLSPKPDLPAHLKAAWEMICRRFVAGLLPDYKYEETVVSFTHDKYPFSCKGEVPLNADKSWIVLYPRQAAPLAIKGSPQSGRIIDVQVKQGKTTPPKPYTEASLINDMLSVSKYVEDPRLKARLKETSGIGTPATRAAIIETLKTRGYIETKGKTITSTAFGKLVVDRCPPPLADPGTTAAWEDALGLISDGKYCPDEFMGRIDIFIQKQIYAIRWRE